MADEVYMDIPQVQDMAKFFGQAEDVLQVFSRVMESLSATLKATAFIGLVGGYAVSAYLDGIKPKVDTAARKMGELNSDINAAVDAYQNGDAQGSTRFF